MMKFEWGGKKTTINVFKETRDRLRGLARPNPKYGKRGHHKMESDDDIICRLLDVYEKVQVEERKQKEERE